MRIAITLLCLVAFSSISATQQFSDVLIFKGKQMPIFSYILEDYFVEKKINKPRCENTTINTMSTACRRGYIAEFTIKNKKLFISNIKIQCQGWNSVMMQYFKKERIHMDWYSGVIVAPLGKMTDEVNEPIFEKYKIFEIVDGECIISYTLSRKKYERFQERKWTEYVKTKKYQIDLKRYSVSKLDSNIDFNLKYLFHQHFNFEEQ